MRAEGRVFPFPPATCATEMPRYAQTPIRFNRRENRHGDLCVSIIKAQDDQRLTAFGFALGSAGNVRTQTLHAFTKEEVGSILDRLP